ISYAYWNLCSIHIDRKDHRAATTAIAEYLGIEPNGYEESAEATGFLCRCIRLCLEDPSMPETERKALARSLADRAMNPLSTAVRNGFREAMYLESDPAYEPLRSRDDFRRLVRELKMMTETSASRP